MSNPTSRYVSIRPDNIPADGVVSFKNGFPILSFTISAQDGLLDPSTIRIVGDLKVFKNNNTPTPDPVTSADAITMDSRLGIYNVFDQLTVRSQRTRMIAEQIRHYSKWFNTYQTFTSSLNDQMGHLATTTLCMPNSVTFKNSVVNNNASGTAKSSFSAHLPCGFCQSGNLVDLRADAFGGIIVEIMLTPDANVLYFNNGVVGAGLGEAHYTLNNLELCCEITDLDGSTPVQSQGSYQFNSITSLYTSINSNNAQIQYSLALKNLQSAFMTFMPVANINTLTANGQSTTYLSNASASASGGQLAPIRRVQFLKGGVKHPAEFDYNNVILDDPDTQLPDPQIVKGLVDAVVPPYHQLRTTASPVNMNRDYVMGTANTEDSYNNVANGGSVYALGVKYGIGDQGEDFTNQQFGVSIESDLTTDNPMGVYLFFKSKSTLVYNQNGIQLLQ